jgi:hypothetical protein
MLNRKEKTTRSKRISDKNLKVRNELWPNIDPNLIYNRKKEKGFTTIPRTMPLILLLMDELSNGKPISSTFLSLWCRIFDEGLIVIRNPKDLAFEAGFTGERAEATWRSRMKILSDLGFIDAKSGTTGQFHYILIFNPHKIIEKLKTDKKLRQTASYNSYYERFVEIGASNSPEEDI